MSKIVVSLPKGMVKHSLIGGLIALVAYVALQLVWALLIHKELLGMEQMYPMVCIAAALSSFLGCLYSVVSRKEARVLTVSAVVVVFLTVTLAAALLTTKTVAVTNGLTGVGLSMAAGGLLAALAGDTRKGRGKRDRARARRKKRT